jgi:hypothetical protein
VFGFQGPPESIEPGSDFSVEDLDAFNEGVLAGQTAAIEGLPFVDNPCVDLHREPPPDFPELAWSGLDAAAAIRELVELGFKKAMGGAIVGAVTTLIDLSIALETHFDEPLTALAKYASRLQELLGDMGTTGGAALFIGGAVDFDQVGCELQVTPVFRASDSAMQAARNLARPGPKLVVRWRTDQSGGATVVDSEE